MEPKQGSWFSNLGRPKGFLLLEQRWKSHIMRQVCLHVHQHLAIIIGVFIITISIYN